MTSETDAFGRALLAWAHGGTTPEIVERDDGYTESGAGPEVYLSDFKGWPLAERQSVRHMRGRVLDVGCGAGRVALELQRRGVDVVGLDSSRLAVKAARRRGVNEVWCTSTEKLGRRIASFDTIVLFGNNLGIFGTPERAREALTQWAQSTKPEARLFIESTNPYCGGAPGIDRGYYQRNREQGKLPGQATFRYHYEYFVGEWFPWLFVSRRDFREIVRGTGWHQVRVLGERPSEPYVAILEKD
ncbi:MAG TPA: class I SAM-dependent methyltransferase [Acidimicrobiales bacterium]|nr:class I SAM-dependent methyltransferase [Acidimicrobiales bacterium]